MKKKIKTTKVTETVFKAGKVYDCNEVIAKLKEVGGRIIFDITRQLTIPIIEWIEREETSAEEKAREEKEKHEKEKRELQEVNLFNELKQKYEPIKKVEK